MSSLSYTAIVNSEFINEEISMSFCSKKFYGGGGGGGKAFI